MSGSLTGQEGSVDAGHLRPTDRAAALKRGHALDVLRGRIGAITGNPAIIGIQEQLGTERRRELDAGGDGEKGGETGWPARQLFGPWRRPGGADVIEMRPNGYGDTPAVLVLALTALWEQRAIGERRPLLLVVTANLLREFGAPYGPGLLALGVDPARLLVVAAPSRQEALWAIEEGLRSGAAAAVLGAVHDVAMTAGRRLQLAANHGATPCVLATGHADPPVAVAHARWCVATLPGAAHPFDAAAPGAPRWRVLLERVRIQRAQRVFAAAAGQSFDVEYSDGTRGLRVVSGLAGRADPAGATRHAAG